ncbi:hypothetical protein BOO86_27295 [Mycobacterium sp. CBMA 234]|uniref:hypothetical protein n=1 Tax=Mycolicibacterium sp. CBMA 234 TaxID=1918495 RepID=UPI0012DF36BF|nr:hypothetical protein [Mycolicibacterium sp. CBMA 234]MUL68205.1 hypothetical protein [Mycolicibacterium sp. CBMA 234]
MVGTNDHVVPSVVSDSYVKAAKAIGGDANMVLLDGADHVSIVDPAAPTFLLVVETISRAARMAHAT